MRVAIAARRSAITMSMSCLLVSLPMLRRRALPARSSGMPMASSIGDGLDSRNMMILSVCVCVRACVCARAHVCVCVCVCVCECESERSQTPHSLIQVL